jgi:hypothetical protein
MEDISLHFPRAGRLVVQGTRCEGALGALGIPWEAVARLHRRRANRETFLPGFLKAP